MYILDQLTILHNELGMEFEAIYTGKINKDNWECGRYLINLTNIFTKKVFQLDFYIGVGWLKQNRKPTPFDVLYSIKMDNPNDIVNHILMEEKGRKMLLSYKMKYNKTNFISPRRKKS